MAQVNKTRTYSTGGQLTATNYNDDRDEIINGVNSINNSQIASGADIEPTKILGTAATLTGSQTLTNKTLTSPVINTSISGTAIVDEDNMASNSATQVPTQQSVKAYVDASSSVGGWTSYSAVTPTSNTLDDPTFELVFAGVDLSTTLYSGMKIRITQGTVKYFIITKVAFSTNTTVTIYGGSDYDLVSTGTTAITAFAYSFAKSPSGFPMSPNKWTLESAAAPSSQSSPTANTWYNLGGSLAIHIGSWRVYYESAVYVSKAATTGIDAYSTLSTANNSETDTEMTASIINEDNTSTTHGMAGVVYKETCYDLTAKATYYLNCKTGQSSVNTLNLGINQTNIIRAVCAYL